MAKLVEGDSRGIHRGSIGSAPPRLPPRIPSIPGRGLPPSDLWTGIYSNQSFESLGKSQRQHRRTPSCNMAIQEQPLWLDDILEDSEGSSKKGSHRRSASDSFTYLENAGSLCNFSNIAEKDEVERSSFVLPEKARSTNSISTNRLTDLLEEIQQLQDQRNGPISALIQPAISRSEISKVDEMRTFSNIPGNAIMKGLPGQSVFAPEVKSVEAADIGSHDNLAGDVSLDPKKAKSVLANRQSAQRSRVRKLQYIAELERIVNALETQVSALSPQLLLFQHQWALVNRDNSALKQKIAVCVGEKSIKDSQNETLSSEVQRLQTLRELQMLHEPQRQKQQPHRIQRHSSLPSDFGAHIQQYNEFRANSQQSEPDTSSPDVLPRVMEELAGMSLNGRTR
eukprot:c15933_g2_i1 orf=893-2080(+)